jgi:4,5-DOPA dioxygenase extradiol
LKRNNFLKTLAFFPMAASAIKLKDMAGIADNPGNTAHMPVLFLGHGSPMNAIEENEFVRGFMEVGKTLPKPEAILCISAHWETKGTFVTAMEKPPTIHDFGGFPRELFEVQYPALGSPALAKEIQNLVDKTPVGLDDKWGLDHGAWSVLKHLYPKADVPVIEMSLDYFQGPQYHFELAAQLAPLREKGILIVGSGNMVHNLGLVAWDKFETDNFGYDWALEASESFKKNIMDGDFRQLIDYRNLGRAAQLAVPTPEHFLPLLYALALKKEKEPMALFNDKAVAGSLTMTSVKIG